MNTGFFRYSRQPNWFCELDMWWVFFLFVVAASGSGSTGPGIPRFSFWVTGYTGEALKSAEIAGHGRGFSFWVTGYTGEAGDGHGKIQPDSSFSFWVTGYTGEALRGRFALSQVFRFQFLGDWLYW